MIERQAGRLVVTAPLVMDNARTLLEAGRAALQPGEQVIDLGQVLEADSSALAVMLGWLRGANLSRSTCALWPNSTALQNFCRSPKRLSHECCCFHR